MLLVVNWEDLLRIGSKILTRLIILFNMWKNDDKRKTICYHRLSYTDTNWDRLGPIQIVPISLFFGTIFTKGRCGQYRERECCNWNRMDQQRVYFPKVSIQKLSNGRPCWVVYCFRCNVYTSHDIDLQDLRCNCCSQQSILTCLTIGIKS